MTTILTVKPLSNLKPLNPQAQILNPKYPKDQAMTTVNANLNPKPLSNPKPLNPPTPIS